MVRTAAVVGLGQLGAEAARQLLAAGVEVRALCLSGDRVPTDLADQISVVVGDRKDEEAFGAFIGRGADTVVDTVAFTSADAHQLVRHAEDVGALAVVSSVAVYRDPDGRSVGVGEPDFGDPLTEDGPLVPATDDTYGGGKVLVERILLAQSSRPVTVVRPAAVCGPGSVHLREWWLVKRVLDGRRVVPIRHGRSAFHTSTTANVAALLLHGATTGTTGVFNAADPDPMSVQGLAELGAETMGHTWTLALVPDSDATTVGDTPWSAQHPILLDTSAAAAAGFVPPTSYREALPSLVEAARREVGDRDWREVYPSLAGYPTEQFDYAAEDAWLRAAVSGPAGRPPRDFCGVGPVNTPLG